ncbi:hypothetical protein RN22_20070 [Grimontia sp. AD028]|uniref:Uncharacterized protein n=1 Tax=Grimontia indica TaxID=1056512 RepID=R1IPA1_9GAMM|nr:MULTISPECIES: hypothetical protein [Grimontia]EOD77205.1 hypothetical protein D515_04503 [Grimontia indica]KKD58660.1 hypothetical protein RN22_20070 [Grimontia sp. AD028]
MKILPYEELEEATLVADTKLVNGVYVMDRRDRSDRRKNRGKFQGYDRRVSADRRAGTGGIDEII